MSYKGIRYEGSIVGKLELIQKRRNRKSGLCGVFFDPPRHLIYNGRYVRASRTAAI